ncbi:MAG: cytidine deaminase [Atopobiaceae bacterium]|nr:cytidine deaminase [Atopobiaceae bacterium]
MDGKALLDAALEAREHAYTPYSHWAVGAALLCSDGTVYQGCNIENAAYTPSNCAERTAFFKAIYDGHRSFEAIAVVGGPEGQEAPDVCAPCGVCRQVMREFCDLDEFRIVLGTSAGVADIVTLRELLPWSFGPENLGK